MSGVYRNNQTKDCITHIFLSFIIKNWLKIQFSSYLRPIVPVGVQKKAEHFGCEGRKLWDVISDRLIEKCRLQPKCRLETKDPDISHVG